MPKNGRHNLYARLALKQEGRCHYCEVKLDIRVQKLEPTLDHLEPKSRGGKGGQNLVIACRSCNELKGPLSEAEFLVALKGGKAKAEAAKIRRSQAIAKETAAPSAR